MPHPAPHLGTGQREPYVDWLRAFSLIVVVLWHWVFTIIHWTPNGPQPTTPLAYYHAVWVLTWVLQVVPLFFYVGGYVHLLSWEHARARGEHMGRYLWVHLRQLLVPGLWVVAVWVAVGAIVHAVFKAGWIFNTVLLIISPLWFLGMYVALLAMLPLAMWLHRRFGPLVLVWLAGIALGADVLRLSWGVWWAGWINMVAVWGLAYEAGFYYRRLADAPRRYSFVVMWAGLFALAGLVFSGLYPGSMVGVPGQRLSNMSPPTVTIVALLAFQIGLAQVLRPVVERGLARPHWRRLNELINTYALPLYLFHGTGMALWLMSVYGLYTHHLSDDRAPDLIWWAERPLAIAGPLLFTVPLIALFGRHLTHRVGTAGSREELSSGDRKIG